MKRIVFCFCMMLAAVSVIANDGSYMASGNQLIPLEETQISVKKEVLTISLRDDGYADVDVMYEFYNPSYMARDVKMGFESDPPYNAGYDYNPDGENPFIKNFTVEMNGEKLRHRNGVAVDNENDVPQFVNASEWKMDDEMGMTIINKTTGEQKDYSYVYFFDAHFKPGRNVVRHTYSYCLSVIVGTTWQLDYKLSPASRWSGNHIEDFTLVIKAENTAKHFVIDKDIFGVGNNFVKKKGAVKMRSLKMGDYMNAWEIAMRNGEIQLHMTNFLPDAEKELVISSADSYYSYNTDDRLYHFGAFYDRGSMAFVTMSDMMDKNSVVPRDMAFRQRICRNLPFASRGHVFKDAKLKKYFESLFWYMPDPTYKDDMSGFTKTDKEVMNYKLGENPE